MTTNVVQLRDVPSARDGVSEAEWEARVDLAAAYRLAHEYRWADSIYNHISMRVPDDPDFFLIKAHELLYNEVSASNLVKVDMRLEDVDEAVHVNRPGFTLHGGLLSVRKDVNCFFHTHIPACIAVANQKDGLLPLSQTAMTFTDQIGYHEYEGITENLEERERIAANLGDKKVLLMRNHGVVTSGRTVRDAFILMRDIATACELQLSQQAAGADFVLPSAEVLETYAVQRKSHNAGRGSADWPGFLRRLDQIDSSYRD
ncbi:MAG: class II aldolase/adducin family protein [Alphaproteobacteria bacterium]|nr:class II aldolase/adducin family protein [Alphaproteobacteria bacterium]